MTRTEAARMIIEITKCVQGVACTARHDGDEWWVEVMNTETREIIDYIVA